MRSVFKRFMEDDRGISTVEMVMIAAVLIGVVVFAFPQLKAILQNFFQNRVGGQLMGDYSR